MIAVLAVRVEIIAIPPPDKQGGSMRCGYGFDNSVRQWMEYLLSRLGSGCLKIAKTIGRWRWR
jgi:hypothetical protein